MELDQLRYFVQVVEHGSFSRAAAVLNVSQPSLSRRIRQLEVELRRHLFYRHGRGIGLTDDGTRFLETAKLVLRELQQAMEIMGEHDSELTGKFSLGLTPTLAGLISVPLLKAFKNKFPKANISVVVGLSTSIHGGLLGNKLDVALLRDQPPSALIQIERVLTEPLCLIAPRSSPLRGRKTVPFAQLVEFPLILPSAPNAVRSMIESNAARIGLKVEVVHDVDSTETILELVAAGFGYSVAPKTVVEASRWREDLEVIRLVQPELKTTVGLATLTRHPPTALYTAAVEMVRDVLKNVCGDVAD